MLATGLASGAAGGILSSMEKSPNDATPEGRADRRSRILRNALIAGGAGAIGGGALSYGLHSAENMIPATDKTPGEKTENLLSNPITRSVNALIGGGIASRNGNPASNRSALGLLGKLRIGNTAAQKIHDAAGAKGVRSPVNPLQDVVTSRDPGIARQALGDLFGNHQTNPSNFRKAVRVMTEGAGQRGGQFAHYGELEKALLDAGVAPAGATLGRTRALFNRTVRPVATPLAAGAGFMLPEIWRGGGDLARYLGNAWNAE